LISFKAAWIAEPSSKFPVSFNPHILSQEQALCKLTDLVKLDGVVFGSHVVEKGLCCFAVWAVGFREDRYDYG